MNKQEKIIAQIESLLGALKGEIGISPAPRHQARPTNEDKPFSGLTEEIFNLVSEGFFDQSKTLAEIQKKLKEGGVNKPTTSLMKPIILLIRKKMLIRTKPEKGQYQYRKNIK